MVAVEDLRCPPKEGGHRVVLKADEVRIETPPVEHLVFYVGVGVLAAIEIIEWPVALLVTAGPPVSRT